MGKILGVWLHCFILMTMLMTLGQGCLMGKVWGCTALFSAALCPWTRSSTNDEGPTLANTSSAGSVGVGVIKTHHPQAVIPTTQGRRSLTRVSRQVG
jgi:hypothetical protein